MPSQREREDPLGKLIDRAVGTMLSVTLHKITDGRFSVGLIEGPFPSMSRSFMREKKVHENLCFSVFLSFFFDLRKVALISNV